MARVDICPSTLPILLKFHASNSGGNVFYTLYCVRTLSAHPTGLLPSHQFQATLGGQLSPSPILVGRYPSPGFVSGARSFSGVYRRHGFNSALSFPVLSIFFSSACERQDQYSWRASWALDILNSGSHVLHCRLWPIVFAALGVVGVERFCVK